MNWRQNISALLGFERKAETIGTPLHQIAAARDGKVLNPEWSSERATLEGLKASTWVYASVRRISTAFSNVPLKLERVNGDGWEADPTHPLAKLLRKPNPHMSLQDLLETWAHHIHLAGNSLWYVNLSAQNLPLELWPLQPDRIRPIQSRENWLEGYEYKIGNEKQRLEPRQVVHWKFVDPSDPYWGMSPLQAAARAVDTDIAAGAWNSRVLANGAQPPFAVLFEKSMTIPQSRDAVAQISEQIAGSGNARRFMVLGGASKVQPISLNAQELDWLEGRKFSREEIGAAFGVPSVLLMAGESVTFANLDAAKRILWEDTVVPLLEDFCRTLEMGLLGLYGAHDTHRIVPDLSGVAALQENMQQKAQTALTLVQAGWSLNAVNERLKLGFDEAVTTPQGQPLTAPLEGLSKGASPLETKDARDDADQKAMDRWEKGLLERLIEFFRSLGRKVSEAYAAALNWLDALDEELVTLEALIAGAQTAILETQGAATFAALAEEIAPKVVGSFSLLDPRVIDWAEEHVASSVTSIADTTRDLVRGQIARGIEEGLSTSQIARDLRSSSAFSATRAETIARTEVGAAFNNANQLAAEQFSEVAEVTLLKQWRATKDARTRDSHVNLNGKTVPMDEDFKPGLGHPHDPRAPAAEVVRCRCVLRYVEALTPR